MTVALQFKADGKYSIDRTPKNEACTEHVPSAFNLSTTRKMFPEMFDADLKEQTPVVGRVVRNAPEVARRPAFAVGASFGSCALTEKSIVNCPPTALVLDTV